MRNSCIPVVSTTVRMGHWRSSYFLLSRLTRSGTPAFSTFFELFSSSLSFAKNGSWLVSISGMVVAGVQGWICVEIPELCFCGEPDVSSHSQIVNTGYHTPCFCASKHVSSLAYFACAGVNAALLVMIFLILVKALVSSEQYAMECRWYIDTSKSAT